MIEAPCAACGTVNRIAENELPAGAKFVTCQSCKSRVALPTQKAAAAPKPAAPGAPPPIPKAPQLSKAPTIDLADLPAPKRSSALAGAGDTKPAPKSALAAFEADLPAPKPKHAPAAAPAALSFDDLLPAPEAPGGDLPAPKPKTPPARPTPSPMKDVGLDLPAPAPRVPAAALDLPAPAPRVKIPAKAEPPPPITDLPAPKVAGGNYTDLPTPKAKTPRPIDLPVPTGIVDLPAPKGGIVDLPAPKTGQEVAPKGFFDDLPQPAKKPAGQEVAPKGFFDDLPAPAKPNAPDLPAPKGFFDDLPQPARPNAGAGGALFDDLPNPSKGAGDVVNDAGTLDFELGPAASSGLELDHGPSSLPGMTIDDNAPSGDAFDLDLAEPVKPQIRIDTPEGMKLKAPSKGAAPSKPLTPLSTLPSMGAPSKGLELEIEDGMRGTPAAVAQEKKVAKKKQTATESAEAKAARAKRTKIALGALLGVATLGAGGFVMYQRHSRAQERADLVDASIAEARVALTAADKNHWSHAIAAADAAIELDSSNAQALGIDAEASLAAVLDNGINAQARTNSARRMINDAIAAGHAGPELEHAQALASIVSGNPDAAIQKLNAMLAREPKNGFLLLYMGWAQLAKGDGKAALDAFGNAVAASPAVKLPALYGHGRAKLLLADPAGARTDFTTVYETDKDHIGAQVGLAETEPPQQTSQKEQELLAILARKDIDKADPRAVVRAWSLAADVARLGGRLDVARERYHKALVIAPNDVATLTGAAWVELRDNKLAIASDMLQKALTIAKDDPAAQLAIAELNVRQGKLPDAVKSLKALDARTPPLAPLLHAQLQIVKGKLLEAQGQDEDAVAAYEQGAKDAGDLDLSPTMAAVEKLSAMAKKADAAKATEYRDRADKLLSALAERAQDDAMLSMTLGVAYLQAGDATKAEGLLRRATEMNVTNLEAKLELAKALVKLNKTDESIDQLKKAFALDPSRGDIALELARTDEQAGRDDDAKKMYDALLANKDAPTTARVHAGKFYARKGDLKQAAEQAALILAAEPDNAAGHYLKGEGLLGAGNLDDARKELALAVDADPEAQYLDAQGRAAEKTYEKTNEIKFLDLALRAYSRATDNDPKQFNSWAGQGRIYVARKEWEQAAKPLSAANALNKQDAEVMFNLGLTAAKLQQKPVAVQWFVAAQKIKPTAEGAHQLGLLYFDLNQPPLALQAFRSSTSLGAELEKQTGKEVEWLTEDYFQLGAMVPLSSRDCHLQREAWERFLMRNPKPSARVDEAKRALATSLKTC
jgi:tetratricopeptide (TPR) repeat protein